MTFEIIAKMLAEYKGIDVDSITMDSTFEELTLDSLDIADLVMQIEDEMNITIELDPSVTDMKALVAMIDEAKKA
jgi:acyl carrier protein